MFGAKARTIKFLKEDFERVRTQRNDYYDRLARKESELTVIQEAFRNGVNITDDLKAEVERLKEEVQKADAYADESIRDLEYKIAEARLQNENLREEALESSRMLELYKALVASLRIVIKLPAKKTRG